MVCVFMSFMLGEDRVIKEFGLSLASAVFLDALVVRCLLLPATISLIGSVTWSLPAWLGRLLPRLNIEGTAAARRRGRDAGRAGGASRKWRLSSRSARDGKRGSGDLSWVGRGAALALLCASALCASALCASASSVRAQSTPGQPSVLLAFLPAGEQQLAGVDGMSVGIMSATQGSLQQRPAPARHHPGSADLLLRV